MKIKQSIIDEFLKKASLDNKAKAIMMQTTSDFLEAQVFYEDAIYIEIKVSKEHIQDFVEGIKMPIRDIELLRKLMKDKEGEIELKVENNKLLISTEKTAISYNLCDVKFIKTFPEKIPNFVFPEESVISSSFFKAISTSYKALEPPMIYIDIKDNMIIASLKGEVDNAEEKEKVLHGDAHSSFGAYLPDIANFLEDNCVVSLKDDFPIRIKSNSDKVLFTVVVSPKLKSDEPKKEGDGKEGEKNGDEKEE